MGASGWAIELARAMASAGASVMLADSRYRRGAAARQAGFEVHFGDVLSEETALELPCERVSMLLAATADDSYNRLVSLRSASASSTSTPAGSSCRSGATRGRS